MEQAINWLVGGLLGPLFVLFIGFIVKSNIDYWTALYNMTPQERKEFREEERREMSIW